MFTLRKITHEAIEMNFDLGKNYTLVEEALSPREFQRIYKEMYGHEKPSDLAEGEDNIYAFVIPEGGAEVYDIYRNHYNFIMTEGGKTFAKI